MKTVSYGEGVVTFDLPSDWCEDVDPLGSARYYADGEDTGTMRLNILPFDHPQTLTLETAAREVFRDQSCEWLANGLPLRHTLATVDEHGESLHLHRWDILVPVTENQWRLVCFGYTTLASRAETADAQEELRIVETAVRHARHAGIA